MSALDHAASLLAVAHKDLRALDGMGDPETFANEVFGFHAQQAVEKALKACCLAAGLPLKRTHSIQELRRDLRRLGWEIDLSEEDAELLDSIYLPSKYPLGSALPEFEIDVSLADRCVFTAGRVLVSARSAIQRP